MHKDETGILIESVNEQGLITAGAFTVAVPTTANKFAAGCILVGNDGKVYTNAGTSASPSFQDINSINTSEIADGAVTPAKLSFMTAGNHPTRDVYQFGSITDNAKIAVAGDNVNVFSIEGKSSASSASAGAKIANFGWVTYNDSYNNADALGTKKNRFNIGSNIDADLLLSSPHQIRISAADNTVQTVGNGDAVDTNGAGNIAMIARSDMKFAPWSGAEDINAQYLRLTAVTETIFNADTGTYNGGDLVMTTVSGPLHINGVSIGTGSVHNQTTTGLIMPWIYTAAQEEIAGNVGGAISIVTHLTFISSDAGGDAFTLASGSAIGQLKKIIFRTDGGGNAVVTGAFTGANNTLTFDDAGEYALMQWNGTDWIILESASTLDLTNAPVLSTV